MQIAPWAAASRIRCALSQPVRVDDVDPHRLAAGEGTHHGTKGPGRAARTADDPTEVIGMDPNLEDLAAALILAPDSHILIVVDDTLDQVLQRFVEHDQTSGLATSEALSALSAFGSSFSTLASALSAFGSSFSTLASALSAFGSSFSTLGSALSALGAAFSVLTSVFLGSALSALGSALSAFSAFGSAFFRFVVAPSLGSDMADLVAASYSAVLSGFGSARRRVPSVPGRPLNVCQSPVIFRSAATCSVGWAPTPSQYCTRSELISMIEGSWVGWYLPISSIARPSRLVREFMMTTR